MTKELRERYWKKFWDWKNTPHDMIQKFYEQAIVEAERRGETRMKEKIVNLTRQIDDYVMLIEVLDNL